MKKINNCLEIKVMEQYQVNHNTSESMLVRSNWSVRLPMALGCRVILIALLSVFGSIVLQAQQAQEDADNPRSAEIRVRALARGDSVVLRWVVSNPGGWRTANRLGFIIERMEVDTTKSITEQADLRLTPKPLVPWTLDEWKARSKRDDKFAAIAAQCLYGKRFMPDVSGSAPDRFVDNLRLAALELENRYSFAMFAADVSAHVADGSALRFTDHDVKPGRAYIYTVSTASVDSTFSISRGITTVIAGEHYYRPPAPLRMEIEELDKKINIRWANLEIEGFTAYNLYRSEDGGKSHKLLNTSPILPMKSDKTRNAPADDEARGGVPGLFTDSVIVNGREYTYCLRGITPFAEESDCATVKGMGRDLTPPGAVNEIKTRQTGTHALEISWSSARVSSDAAGYFVTKSSKAESGFYTLNERLLPKNTMKFRDTDANETEPYYIIETYDSAGNVSRSLPVMAGIIDSSSPGKPIGLNGTIDTNGIVSLSWLPGEEYNLMGYRVYRANDSTHEFTQIAQSIVEDTVYTDSVTINTLSRFVYYRISAVSRRYMPSEMSDILALRRPDIIAPEPAVFTSFSVTDSSIELKWEFSRSNDAAVQHLLRRQAGQADWEKIAELMPSIGFYSDKNLTGNTNYEYAVRTVDESGLTSLTGSIISARSAMPVRTGSISSLNAAYDESARAIIIKWNYPIPDDGVKYWFALYRSFRGQSETGAEPPMQIYQAIEPGKRDFLDNMLTGKGKYNYSLKLMTEKGAAAVSGNVIVEVK